MKYNMTELVFILDRSGSMGGMESDTIGGFNSMLTKQQSEPSERRITTVLFDNQYEILHDRIDIKAVSTITEREYSVRAQTALFDAIGLTIKKIGGVQKNTSDEYRADKVLFVITTDGMENASREFDLDIRMLGVTLGAIAGCEAKPDFNIKFSMKDPSAVSEQLLDNAIENAKWKATILAKSAGVKLGEIQRIDYNWSELHLYPQTDYQLDNLMVCEAAAPLAMDIEPEDIKVNDTATIVWAIE